MSSQVNSFVLDFPLQRSSSVGNNTGAFAAGTYYPFATDYQSITWDFGDGTVQTTLISSTSATQARLINELSKYTGFFPEWQKTQRLIAQVAAPAFNVSHTYDAPGTYNVNATITTLNNISYVGIDEPVNILESSQVYKMPSNWSNISKEYAPSDGTDLLFTNGFPVVQTSTQSVSSLPQDVTFTISNIFGRTDVDYIEWVFGDGSTSVSTVLGSPVLQDLAQITYAYSLLPSELNYTASAVLYVRKGQTKYKVVVQSPDIVFQNRANINVSFAPNGTSLKTYGFNVTPSFTDTLPVECKFIVPVTRELKYIFWNHDDGTYDVTPVQYDETRAYINQYVIHKHLYTSLNNNPLLPGCILVFRDQTGKLYSEYHRSRNYLNFDRGLINRGANYFVEPIYGIDGFEKFNNLTILPVYKDNGTADVYIRVSLAFPSQVPLFDKIIWNINNREIVQDKNTSKDFGYIIVKDVAVPYTNFSVSTLLYGRPSIYSNANLDELTLHAEYSHTTTIYTYEQFLTLRESGLQIIAAQNAIIPVLPPTLSAVDEQGNIEILTPVIETTSTVPVTSFSSLTGINIHYSKLFDAISPASNFMNRDFPSTASTGEFAVTVPKREVGFFTPSQTSNIIVEPGQFTFTADIEAIDFNKPYYFPDPYKYGSDTPVLTFSFNEDSFKNGSLFTIARNRPNTSDNFITFDGYTSQKPISEEYDITDVVNSGYFHNFADDIYGNRYGLIKANNFESGVAVGNPVNSYTVVFNGYKFFDSYFGNGYNFNYYTPLTSGNEIIVPGLSTFTDTFSNTSTRYTLNFGTFARDKYLYAKEPFDVVTQYRLPLNIGFRDCATFVVRGSELLADSISSDLSTFSTSTTGTYYYSELFEAGVFTAIPYQRPLVDVLYPSITARFTQSVRVSGDNGVDDVDCALFNTTIPVEKDLFNLNTIVQDLSSVDPLSVTQYTQTSGTTADLITRNGVNGVLYLKDRNDNVGTLLETLSYLNTRFDTSVITQLSAYVQDFDVVYNTLFVQTSSMLVIDKITYSSGFVAPDAPGKVINYNADSFNKLSNRYKVDSNVYFVTLSAFNTGSQSIVPMIYKYDLNTSKVNVVYPNNTTYIADNIITGDVVYTEASAPVLSYTPETKTFNIAYVAKDQNKAPTVVFINFKDTLSNVITKSAFTNLGGTAETTLFTSLSTLNSFIAPLSSQTITFNNSTMVL